MVMSMVFGALPSLMSYIIHMAFGAAIAVYFEHKWPIDAPKD